MNDTANADTIYTQKLWDLHYKYWCKLHNTTGVLDCNLEMQITLQWNSEKIRDTLDCSSGALQCTSEIIYVITTWWITSEIQIHITE